MTKLTILFSLLCVSGLADADELIVQDDASKKGLEIVTEYDERDQGFVDSSVDMEMILMNSRGQSSTRILRSKTVEVDSNDIGEKRLVIFDRPRDVKGTVLLTSSRKTKDDEQWLYLPTIKRVKRITSSNKTGPFMGSEFAYEDLSAFEINKYSYRYIEKTPCEGGECFKVERYPVDKYSGYTRQIIWLDDQHYRLWKIEFYDRKDELLKTLDIADYQQYGKYWRPDSMVMSNVQTGKKTILNWTNYQFGNGVSENEFAANQLSKIR